MKIFIRVNIFCLGLLGAAAGAHAQSNLFVANLGSNTVSGYSTITGTSVGSFSGGDAYSSINQPVGLAASGNNLFVTSYNTNSGLSSILRLGSDGIHSTVVDPAPNGFPSNGLLNPKAIVFGANANTLYVANGGNAGVDPVNNSYVGVANVTTGGYGQVPSNQGGIGFGGAGPLAAPYSLAYDGSRYLYASNNTLSSQDIVRFDTTIPRDPGTLLTLSSASGAPAIDSLNGLAIGPDGALYATDGTNRNVLRITTPNLNTSDFSIFVDGNATLNANRLVGPEALIFDPTGTFLYVSNDDNSIKRIAVANLNGTETTSGLVTPFVQEAANSGPGFMAFSPIPEPSTYALFGVAGVSMLIFSLKRRQSASLRA